MVVFEDIQDVDEWLAPYDYAAFWEAVAPWNIFSRADRDHVEGLITRGEVPEQMILEGMKVMASLVLRQRFGLKDRTHEPPDAQYLRRTH